MCIYMLTVDMLVMGFRCDDIFYICFFNVTLCLFTLIQTCFCHVHVLHFKAEDIWTFIIETFVGSLCVFYSTIF